jgi:hypothetical protein
MSIKNMILNAFLATTLLCLCFQVSNAQQKKGDMEIIGSSSSGFGLVFGGASRPRTLEGSSGSFFSSYSEQYFNVAGELGYFVTRRHEIGGGLSFSVYHYSSCLKSYDNGKILGESCDSGTHAGLGLSGFYRYNFGRGEAKRFPFIGATLSVASVSQNFTGNFRARPHVGYKYFLKKSVALDFSVGYLFDINEVSGRDRFFIQDRSNSMDGRVGLSFVF